MELHQEAGAVEEVGTIFEVIYSSTTNFEMMEVRALSLEGFVVLSGWQIVICRAQGVNTLRLSGKRSETVVTVMVQKTRRAGSEELVLAMATI